MSIGIDALRIKTAPENASVLDDGFLYSCAALGCALAIEVALVWHFSEEFQAGDTIMARESFSEPWACCANCGEDSAYQITVMEIKRMRRSK